MLLSGLLRSVPKCQESVRRPRERATRRGRTTHVVDDARVRRDGLEAPVLRSLGLVSTRSVAGEGQVRAHILQRMRARRNVVEEQRERRCAPQDFAPRASHVGESVTAPLGGGADRFRSSGAPPARVAAEARALSARTLGLPKLTHSRQPRAPKSSCRRLHLLNGMLLKAHAHNDLAWRRPRTTRDLAPRRSQPASAQSAPFLLSVSARRFDPRNCVLFSRSPRAVESYRAVTNMRHLARANHRWLQRRRGDSAAQSQERLPAEQGHAAAGRRRRKARSASSSGRARGGRASDTATGNLSGAHGPPLGVQDRGTPEECRPEGERECEKKSGKREERRATARGRERGAS